MKGAYILLFLMLRPFVGNGQEVNDRLYNGGMENLKKELFHFISYEAIKYFEGKASVFILQITVNKKTGNTDKRIEFKLFGKDSLDKKIIVDFLTANGSKWNYSVLKKNTVILPIFIAAFCPINQQPSFDWKEIFNDEIPERQKAVFYKPLVIQTFCESEPNRDF